jgi:putative ABC transport system permease protein
MTSLLQDLRHGARLLVRSPGFTIVAVAALAIGIGANTAIFSVIHALMLRPLPYPAADRLAVVWEHNLPRNNRTNVVSPGNFIHWREMNRSFEELGAVSQTFRITLTGSGEPHEYPAQFVSAGFFSVLGVKPILGRALSVEEDRPQSRVAVISERLWRGAFNADPAILSRPVVMNGLPNTIVGVMPATFSFFDSSVDLWLPVGFPPETRNPRGRGILVVGRLKPGVTHESAHDDMVRVHAELTRLFPNFNTGWTARVVPLREQLTGDVRPALLVLLGAVAFVLLIACANVANLLLARATARSRELAVRAALGAARGRLVRQLLGESLVLALAGGAAGLLLAWWALHALRALAAERLPLLRLETVAIDGPVLAFTAAAAIASGVFFGLIPALTASGADLHESLKEGSRPGSASRGARARSAFVVVEVAVALVLLVGAGLLVRSFARLLAVDVGFSTERLTTMRVSLPGSRYGEPALRVQFFDRLLDRIGALPGVQAAGAITNLPLAGLGSATRFAVVGRAAPAPGLEPVCDVRIVAHDYFEALGMPLVRGRFFDSRDTGDAANRVVINATMAKQYWPGEDPIGRRIQVSWSVTGDEEIIGIVGDVRHTSLEREPRATIYWPHARSAAGSMALVLKSSSEGVSPISGTIAAVRALDPLLAVGEIRTMDDVVSRSVAQRQLIMMLLAMFAGAALLLAAVGIYGVIAYGVTQRTQEIGIRMALGAQRRDVMRMVVGHALVLTAAGIVVGGAGALALTQFMSGLLFETKAGDPSTFAGVAALLAAVAALAAYVPGRRASRVDPVVALRAQ